MMKKLLSVAVLGLGLAGCSFYQNPSSEPFTLTTKPGEGNLVVYRDDCCGMGSALNAKLFINGLYVANVDYRSYIETSLKPGKYKILFDVGSPVTTTAIITEGQTTFIRYSRLQAYPMPPQEAMKSIPKIQRLRTFDDNGEVLR